MSYLASALHLAGRGFWVFPLIENGKLPAIEGWQAKATRDPEKIKRLWTCPVLGFEQPFNIGISTGKFMDNDALIGVDIDNKGAKRGDEEILRLELEGNDFPITREHTTPTGGRHLLYRVRGREVPNSASKIAPGVDIRGRGGLLVAPGSTIDGRAYDGTDLEIADAPAWLIARCGARAEPTRPAAVAPARVDQKRAQMRGFVYLTKHAPVALEGDGGDHTTFLVACKLKDYGVEEDAALGMMGEHWNPRCDPPWSYEELKAKVANAYRYGRDPAGSAAPEAQFPPIEQPAQDDGKNPLAKVNDEYCFIERGAFVLRETTDHKGRYVTDHLSVAQMHHVFSNKKLLQNKREEIVSKLWMDWAGRRQYKGVVFAPEQDLGPNWYNLWRGYRVKPAEHGRHPAVEAFCEHALVNVCDGDAQLFDWLMGWFAHLVQKPYEKPLVACVFRGKKGTGKNALVERVGHLFGGHFMVADDERYLTGNFNSHLESCLFMVLDEAHWAGDKKAEGRLKGIVTGTEHVIERKGEEPYKVDNLTRVAIIGNEDWLVPAGEDERRWAVFNVGDGRQQDRAFFQAMREGMEQGGYAHLLRYLMDYPISQDVNQAPNTVALAEQKIESLNPVGKWWHDCLEEGRIVGAEFSDDWPEAIPTAALLRAFKRHAKERNVRGQLPNEYGFGKLLKHLSPNVVKARVRGLTEGSYEYRLGKLVERRTDWATHLGHAVQWPS